jgi:hypothetical protein
VFKEVDREVASMESAIEVGIALFFRKRGGVECLEADREVVSLMPNERTSRGDGD